LLLLLRTSFKRLEVRVAFSSQSELVGVLKEPRENDDGRLFTRYTTSSLSGLANAIPGATTLLLALCSCERLDLKD